MSVPKPTADADTLRVGVLLLPPVQLLDASPADLFGMLTREYLDECALPAPLTGLGIDVAMHYISVEHPSPPLAECSAAAALRTTASLTSPEVQAGRLDVVLLPGPPPSAELAPAAGDFLRAHVAAGADVLTVCTGVFAAAQAGILDGRTVTAPRGLIPQARKRFPLVKFDADRRWVRDGQIWCSGGITNGQDMVGAYIKQRWPGPLGAVVCMLADVGERNEKYESAMAADGAWFVWQIVRALFTGRKTK